MNITNTMPITHVTAALVLSSALLVSATSNANGMSSYMEHALVDVCKAAQSNSTLRLKRTVNEYNLKTDIVAQRVVCNGENISDFAATHGAFKTSDRLNKSIEHVGIVDVALNTNNKLHVSF